MNRIRQPSPAIVVAVLALVAALAGTAIAGPDAITSALSKKKVKQLIEREVAEQIANATGPPGAPGADGVAGANGANGADGTNGTDGTARAYAAVWAHTIAPCTAGTSGDQCTFDHSKGVTAVRRTGTGTYCVTAPGLTPDEVPAAVTVDASTTIGMGLLEAGAMTNSQTCGSTNDFLVFTFKRTNVTVDANGGTNNATAAGPAAGSDDVGFTIVIP
jgi:hypothetical protein